MRFGRRLCLVYLPGATIVMLLGFLVGQAWHDRGGCGLGDECDLGPIYGLAWAAGGLYVCVVAAFIAEAHIRRRGD